MIEQTPKKGGRGMIKSKDGKPFKKGESQSHLSAAKKAGWEKKRLLKNLLNISTGAKFNDQQKADFRKLAALYFGIPEKYITIENMMDFRQIEKAIAKGDTFAYNAVKDRVYGKPKQPLDIDGNLNLETEIVIGKKQIRKD